MPKQPFEGLERKYRGLTKQLKSWIGDWQEIMGLKDWTFYCAYVPGYNQENKNIRATNNALWEYKSASLTFYLAAMAEDDDDENESTLVHELVHCLVAPLVKKESQIKLMEFVVVNTEKALFNAYKAKKRK